MMDSCSRWNNRNMIGRDKPIIYLYNGITWSQDQHYGNQSKDKKNSEKEGKRKIKRKIATWIGCLITWS